MTPGCWVRAWVCRVRFFAAMPCFQRPAGFVLQSKSLGELRVGWSGGGAWFGDAPDGGHTATW